MASKEVLQCLFGRQAYSEGSMVCCLLSGHLEGADVNDGTAAIQSYGHVFLDQRWIKAQGKPTDVFLQSAGIALLDNVKSPNLGPLAANIQAACIFISQQEPCSLADLAKGLFVQFELGANLMPSFRGLSISIVYNVGVMVTRGSSVKQFVFPFTVTAAGITTDHHDLKLTYISLMPISALSAENRLQPVSSYAHECETDEDLRDIDAHSAFPHSTAAILFGADSICSLTYSDRVYVAERIVLRFSFEEATKVVDVLRVRFVQQELRKDKSRVQEKTIDSSVKHIGNALSVNMSIPLNINISTTFSSPIVHVSYYIEVEFFETATAMKDVSAPSSSQLSWSFPVIILARSPLRSAKAEMIACLESSMFCVYQEI